MSSPSSYEQNTDYDIYASGRNPHGSAPHLEYPPSPPPLSAAPYYLPNVIAAIVASVGVVVGSVGPWASLAWITANGATASGWWQGKTTLTLGAVAGIALFTLLNRARTGSGTRWLAPLAWIAPVAGLVCLLIAIISIVNVTSTSHQLVGLQVEWGLWLVAICAVVLCVTGSVAAAQVGTVTEGSQAWMRTAIVISALILLGVALVFSTRWIVINYEPKGSPQPTLGPTATVPSAPSTQPVPNPSTTAPPAQDPEAAAFQQLRQQADYDHPFVSTQLADRWVPQLSSKHPGVRDEGVVWDNVLIWQEYQRLSKQYGAKLLWSGDGWSTFDLDKRDFWVTVAPFAFNDTAGALWWCSNHRLDDDHCYAKLVSMTHPIPGSTAHNPRTDGQGFVESYARCDPGNPPALMAQTTKSLVVVCQAVPGNYYYRGVRVSDGASIELAHAVRTSSGFDVTNPTDGTGYQVRPNVLNIISPSGQVDSEPMVQYASS
jgi:hypothetical protein